MRLGADYPFWGAAAAAQIALLSADTITPGAIESRLLAAVRDPQHLSEPEESILIYFEASIGARDQALSRLARVEPGPLALLYLQDRGYDRIRSDPRFQRLIAASRPAGAPR